MKVRFMQTEKEQRIEELKLSKVQLENDLREMRKRRHMGMDDDRAEDIVEELYRELLDVEAELNYLLNND